MLAGGYLPLNSTNERHTLGETSRTDGGVATGGTSVAAPVRSAAPPAPGSRDENIGGEKYTVGAIPPPEEVWC